MVLSSCQLVDRVQDTIQVRAVSPVARLWHYLFSTVIVWYSCAVLHRDFAIGFDICSVVTAGWYSRIFSFTVHEVEILVKRRVVSGYLNRLDRYLIAIRTTILSGVRVC